MTVKTTCVFSNEPSRVKMAQSILGARLDGRSCGVIWIANNADQGNSQFHFKKRPHFTHILLIFEGLPVVLDRLSEWRRWAIDSGALDVQIEIVQAGIPETEVKEILERRCREWLQPTPNPEDVGIRIGQWIDQGRTREKDDPDLLTMMFGRMGQLLTRLDLVRARFHEAAGMAAGKKADYLRAIDKMIGSKDQNHPGKTPEIASENLTSHIPRLLLYGETGVGKTLIARFLHDRTGERPPRIVIPEYLSKEDSFEYALFGYVHGAYTGGREDGDHGLLLRNVGGVIFLDEIGEANAIIQAKLLAYLDDYRVRPRGWQGTPFYCPTLVVAATNRDLKSLVKKGLFRGDLLARFTDTEIIPPLRDRLESLPFILDCLLQSESINPGGYVREIGDGAFRALKAHPYEGNFRELEDCLRTACRKARLGARTQLRRSDLSL